MLFRDNLRRTAMALVGTRPEPGSGFSQSLDQARRRLATLSGAIALGIVAILFAWLGDEAQRGFARIVAWMPLAPLLLTPLTFAAVVWITRRFVPEARGSGIPQVIAAGAHPELARTRLLSLPVAFAKLAMTAIMLLAGASVGREGPTVQVSAAIMVACHRVLRVPIGAGVLIAGGAAGVAAAFNTPLAGVAFAIEELASAFEQRVAMLVMAAVVVSGLVSLGYSGDYVYFGVMRDTLPVSSVLLIAPLAGIMGGVLGGLFSRMLLGFAGSSHPLIQVFRAHPVRAALVCGAVVAVTGLVSGGATWGTGYETTRGMIEGQTDAPLYFGPAKFLVTVATAISGAPGGIFAPSLSVGAGFGRLLSLLFPRDPFPAIVLLGMTGYFVGVVRAPLTAVIILMETTASRGMILPLFLTAIIADGASTLVCRHKLYHGLSAPFRAGKAADA